MLAAKQLSAELAKYNLDTVYHAIEDGPYHGSADFDLHIFFFPIYATATPHIMLAYLRNLPDGNKTKAAVISTNGRISTRFRDGYQGWALHQARLYLYLKNYDIFFSDTLDYPHNLTIALPPRRERYNWVIITRASSKSPMIASKIARQEKYHRRFFWPNIIWSLPFGILYSLIGRRIIGKLFAVDAACDSCGLCVGKCPVKAIKSIHGRLRWGWNCEGCLRCINICPKQAIQLSAIRVLAFIGAACAIPLYLSRCFIPVSFLSKLGSAGLMTIYAVGCILLFALLDCLLDKLSYLPFFRKIAGWGYTSFYGRYHAGQFGDRLSSKDD